MTKAARFAGAVAAPLLVLGLTGCTSIELPAGGTPLDPIAFFTGVSNGQGSLDTLIASSVPVTVASLGFPEHGGLKLIQRITEGTKPVRVRTWTMKRVGPGRYTGTLTDAAGPVEIVTKGPRADISYQTPSGIRIRQQLALQSDGRTILNRLEAYEFGIRVATLTETISR